MIIFKYFVESVVILELKCLHIALDISQVDNLFRAKQWFITKFPDLGNKEMWIEENIWKLKFAMKLSQCKLKVLQRKEKWNCYFAIELCRMKCWLVLCLRGATFSNYISHHCLHIWGENSWWWQRITRIIPQKGKSSFPGFSTRVKVDHAKDKIFSETVKIFLQFLTFVLAG